MRHLHTSRQNQCAFSAPGTCIWDEKGSFSRCPIGKNDMQETAPHAAFSNNTVFLLTLQVIFHLLASRAEFRKQKLLCQDHDLAWLRARNRLWPA